MSTVKGIWADSEVMMQNFETNNTLRIFLLSVPVVNSKFNLSHLQGKCISALGLILDVVMHDRGR